MKNISDMSGYIKTKEKKPKAKYFVTATIFDKRGRILSVGYNSYEKTHPIQQRLAEAVNLPMKQVLHAEVASILKCRGALDRAHRISISRKNVKGHIGCAKPCPICELAIKTYLPNLKIIEHT